MYIESLFKNYKALKDKACHFCQNDTVYVRYEEGAIKLHLAFPSNKTLGEIDAFKQALATAIEIPPENLRLGIYNQRLFAVGSTPPQSLESLLADQLIFALANGNKLLPNYIQPFAPNNQVYKPIFDCPNRYGNTPFTECLRCIGLKFASNPADIGYYMDYANWMHSMGAEYVLDPNNIHPLAKLLDALPISASGEPVGGASATAMRNELAKFVKEHISKAHLDIGTLVIQANAIQQQSGFLGVMDVVEKLSQGYPEIYDQLQLSQVKTAAPRRSFVQQYQMGLTGYSGPGGYGSYGLSGPTGPTGYGGPSGPSGYGGGYYYPGPTGPSGPGSW
jgi:hypothetical protein